MHRILPVLGLLLTFALIGAAAQPGPDPGHATALDYAQSYVRQQVDEASADPQTYAANHTTPDAVQAEAEHAAWMACWAAHDVAGSTSQAACAPFFAPPVAVEPEPQAEEEAVNTTEVEELAEEVVTAVEEILEDPTDAPNVVVRLVESVLGKVLALVDISSRAASVLGDALSVLGEAMALLGLVAVAPVAGFLHLSHWAADGASDAFDLAALSMVTSVDGLGTLGSVAGEATTDALAAVGSGAEHATGAVAQAARSTATGVGDAAGASVRGVAVAARAVGDGVVAGAEAVGDGAKSAATGIADAAQAVGDAVRDAVQAIFGGSSSPSPSKAPSPRAPVQAPVDTDGVLPNLPVEL
jgi:hypothetical protein